MLKATGWWLTLASVDLRHGIDQPLVIVREAVGRDPRDGDADIFRNRAGTRTNVTCVDAHSIWLSTWRLHEEQFHWPQASDAVWPLTPELLDWPSARVNWRCLAGQPMALPADV
jgi:transposase